MGGGSTWCVRFGSEKWRPLLMFLLMVSSKATGQQNTAASKKDSIPAKAEIFSSGFFDVVNNGQVNTSARVIRLFIGEKGKFQVPVSIYSGVSSNNFQQAQSALKSNDLLTNNFINPLTGIANISVEGGWFRDTTSVTRAGIVYSIGERILTGLKIPATGQPVTGKPINFPNSYAVGGFYMQTGAWEKNNKENIGISWLALRYIACYSHRRQLRLVLSSANTTGIYHGYSVAGGIEIDKVINIKVVFYKYLRGPDPDQGLPIYQFSFNYYVK